jgi:hypothetical protein
MAYGVVHHFVGGTEEQYQASIAAVHPGEGTLPPGQVLHMAGPSGDGWLIVAITTRRKAGSAFATRR